MDKKPSWNDAPEWANWLARDFGGRWYWYADKPRLFDHYWGHGGKSEKSIFGDTTKVYWTETLEKRPTADEVLKKLRPIPADRLLDFLSGLDEERKWHYPNGHTTPIPTSLYNRLVYLGIIDKSGKRSINEGSSNYAEKTIQPYSIWLDYPELTSWDHDLIKRILRTKKGESRLLEYKKIIDVCNERIRQIETE